MIEELPNTAENSQDNTIILKDLKEKFEKLYSSSETKENDFQKFMEENTCLIPDFFKMNHGIHLNTVFVKVPIGNQYISDFMYVTKSSADWNIVHVEIEDPKKRIFNTKNDCLSGKFTKAYAQVEDWRMWFQKPANKATFKENFLNKILLSNMCNNPIFHKFVLLYGRSEELKNDRRINAWSNKKHLNEDIMVATFDSLFDASRHSLSLAKFINQKVKICKAKKFWAPNFSSGLNPADFIFSKADKQSMISEAKESFFYNQNLLSRLEQLGEF